MQISKSKTPDVRVRDQLKHARSIFRNSLQQLSEKQQIPFTINRTLNIFDRH